MSLNWIDFSVIGVYAVLVGGIAVWFARQQRSSQDYFVAGRSMTWFPLAISQAASLLSAISYLGQPGETFGHDLRQIVYVIAGYMSIPLVIFLFINFFYRLGLVSTYEYLELRFNAATRILASAFFVLMRLAWMATMVSATSLVVFKLTGLPVWQCIILTSVLTITYTLLGGMKAIIWTDVLQFSLFIGCLIGVFVVLGLADPPGELLNVIVRDNKHRVFDFSFDPTIRITTWAAILGGMVAALANVTDQISMQRYLSAKSLKEAQKAVWLKPFVSMPAMLALSALGLGLYAHYQIHPDLAVGITSPDEAFPHFILTELPHGLSGLIIAAVFAATMSSMDSGIHSLSTVTIEDYYKRFLRPEAPDRHYLILARWLTLGWGIAVVALALYFRDIGTIVEKMGTLAAPFFGCMLGIFFLGTTTRRTTSWGAFIGGLCGYALVLWVIFCLRRINGVWHPMAWSSSAQQVSWMWYPVISFFGTIVPGYLLSLSMPRKPDVQLRGLTIWDRTNNILDEDIPSA